MKPTLLALILIVLAINGMMLYVGVPLGFLDGRFSYPASAIQPLFAEQGNAGRMLYEQLETIDLLFILLYTWVLVEVTRLFARGLKLRGPAWLAYLPIGVATSADAVETVGILSLLKRFPESAPDLERLVSLATPLKWVALACALAQLAWLLVLQARAKWSSPV